MSNEFYNASGTPSTGSTGSSAVQRAEFLAIAAGFELLPKMAGNGSLPLFVNAGATALEAVSAATARSRLSLTIGTNIQAWDADLDAIAALDSTAGMLAKTAANTYARRTLTGTANKITVSNGDGQAGNPTLNVGADIMDRTIVDAKGDLIVGTAADTVARKAVGSNGQLIVADSTQSDGLIWTDYTRPTLNVNPNWLLDQINEGALYTVNTTGVQGPDGWTGDAVGGGVFKLRTIADPDNAALKCLEISCTTADAAIGATDRYEVYTAIEGYDVADLKIGTASASSLTVLVGLKSNSVTGLLGAFLTNSAGNRFYATTSLTLTGTSEQLLSFTVPMDQTGTWLYTNGIGLKLGLVLAAGSNFQGTAGAWTASTVHTTSAQANFMSVNTNIVYVKRIHVIPGGVALAYASQDIQRELAKGQRQYEKSFNSGVAVAQNTGVSTGELRFNPGVNGGNVPYYTPYFRVSKRAVPTCTLYNTSAANAQVRNITTSTDCSGSGITQAGTELFTLATTIDAGGGVNSQLAVHYTANARLS